MPFWTTNQPSTSCKISKKSNEAILRKIQKYVKSGKFGPFWSIFGQTRIFLKNLVLFYFLVLAKPQLHAKFQKNLMSQSWENWEDGRTDERTDERCQNHMTLAKRGSNKHLSLKPYLNFVHVIKQLIWSIWILTRAVTIIH